MSLSSNSRFFWLLFLSLDIKLLKRLIAIIRREMATQKGTPVKTTGNGYEVSRVFQHKVAQRKVVRRVRQYGSMLIEASRDFRKQYSFPLGKRQADRVCSPFSACLVSTHEDRVSLAFNSSI